MNIYVGNLAYSVTENDLRSAFEPFGQIASINIIKDKFSGQSKGFGFVEMPSADEARSAINDLNGKEFKGRALSVNEGVREQKAVLRGAGPDEDSAAIREAAEAGGGPAGATSRSLLDTGAAVRSDCMPA